MTDAVLGMPLFFFDRCRLMCFAGVNVIGVAGADSAAAAAGARSRGWRRVARNHEYSGGCS